MLAFRLVSQDCKPGFYIGWLNVGDKTPTESSTQTIFERGDGIRHAVAGDDDLLAGSMQGIEGVEELLLQTFFAFHELNVVDEQDVNFAITPFERTDGVVANAIDIFVEERFGGDITNFVIGVVLVHVGTDGMKQVCFAKPRRPVDEERVVGTTGRFRYSLCCGKCELVGCPFDEGVERVPRVESDGCTPTGSRAHCRNTRRSSGRCRHRRQHRCW